MPSCTDVVKRQYEYYPYPPRKPEDEAQRLLAPDIDCLDNLNHYGFGGRRDFVKDFRVLVAGGGTGDSVIFLAEQLRDSNAEIVYMDISQESMQVAQARAQARNLTNIQWRQASLLDIHQHVQGEFDYINCSGVLHHLQNPDAGLAALHSVLAENGVMGLMLYGEYARAGVYQMQALMQLINIGDEDAQDKVDNCKSVLKNLPQGNWFRRGKDLFNDYAIGDAGIYDLFLHSQDRAYTVPQLFDFVGRQGLVINAFMDAHQYWPESYLSDASLLEKIKGQDMAHEYAVGELLGGGIKKHTFYASGKHIHMPDIADLDMVPCLPMNTEIKIYTGFYKLVEKNKNAPAVSFKHEGQAIKFKPSAELAAALKYMDGEKSLDEIYRKASVTGKVKRLAVQRAFAEFYKTLSCRGLLLLRHKDTRRYKTVSELHSSMRVNA